MVIQIENDEERIKIKSAIEKEMSEGYEIKVPRPIEMKIYITDTIFKYNENEVMDKLKNKIIYYEKVN